MSSNTAASIGIPAHSAGRVTDIAVDHSEFAHLDQRQIEQVAALMRAEGLQATVSSIHINGWIRAHDPRW